MSIQYTFDKLGKPGTKVNSPIHTSSWFICRVIRGDDSVPRGLMRWIREYLILKEVRSISLSVTKVGTHSWSVTRQIRKFYYKRDWNPSKEFVYTISRKTTYRLLSETSKSPKWVICPERRNYKVGCFEINGPEVSETRDGVPSLRHPRRNRGERYKCWSFDSISVLNRVNKG